MTKKEAVLVTRKKHSNEKSYEISHLKRKTTGVGKIGQEFRVNTNTIGFQSNPLVVRLNNGNFVIVWESGDSNSGGVYGQLFDAEGTKFGNEFQVNANVNINNSQGISLASLDNGKFIVCWKSQAGGLYCQTLNADGTRSGTEILINDNTNSMLEFKVVGLNNGKFVVTYDYNDYNIGKYGSCYAKVYNSDGTESGSTIDVDNNIHDICKRPQVAKLDNGKFVVIWLSEDYVVDAPNINYGLLGQIFEEEGSKRGSIFSVGDSYLHLEDMVSVKGLKDGKFIVVWRCINDGTPEGEILNADGSKYVERFYVVDPPTSGNIWPSVDGFNDGQFVVVFQDGGYGESDVYGQLFNGDGIKSGLNFLVNSYTSNNQKLPSVASLSDSTFVVTWASHNQDGDSDGVYGQILGTDVDIISTETSGVEKRTNHIALTTLDWITQTIKGVLGY